MGDLLGNAVRFGVADDVLAAGEGIETMLSLRCVLPTLPMVAALSANHLAAMLLPPTLAPALYRPRRRCRRRRGASRSDRNAREAAGIEAIALSPRLGDFNEDLHVFGLDALRAALRIQLAPEDVVPLPALVGHRRDRLTFGCHRRRQLGRRRPNAGRGRAHGLLEGDRTAGGPARQWLAPGYFPPALYGPLHREAK